MRTVQPPLFTPETEWVMPDELKDLTQYKEIAVDLETNDPQLTTLGAGNVVGRGHIAGVALAVEGWSGYFPIGHENGGNMDTTLVFSWLRDIFKDPNKTFIFHNAMYDVCWLRSVGITIKGKIVDTMIAASLINENRLSYRLDSLAKQYVGKGKDEKVLQAAAKAWEVDPKKDLWKLPAMFVGQYAEQDAEATLNLWQRLEVELYSEELTSIFDLELKLFPCLVDMRFKGVRVDLEHADKLKQNLKSNNVSDKKSACFWCTFKFDNPAIYIPKEYVNKQIEAYGCFCSPQCAVAYLKNENIDNSTRWERYSLLNNIYSSIYDYKKNIKPAPNPYYTLDKFYGNLNINQYRKLLENQTLLMVVNKPMTKITPELYEDNNELPDVFNNLINENIESKGNKYRLKRKLTNKEIKHKNSIFSMIQQKVN